MKELSLISRFSRDFSKKPYQHYKCPTCKQGMLVPDQDRFEEIEPPYSRNGHFCDEWDRSWSVYRFSFPCQCDRKSCGEVAYVSGFGEVVEYYNDEHEVDRYVHYCIRSFFPAPDIVDIPSKTPNEVKKLLRKSFELYWLDISAAANALRVSLEALLDALGTRDSKEKADGKKTRLSLHARLQVLNKASQEMAELCFSLKEVGNLGSHGGKVREEHYFTALEIYQYVLSELYDNRGEKAKALADKISADLQGK